MFLMLITPVFYWFLGIPVFQCHNIEDAFLYVLPRALSVLIVMYWLSEGKVMPLVTEIQKMVIVFQVVPAMIAALIRPHGRPFKVTGRPVERKKSVIQWKMMLPFTILQALIGLGVLLNLVPDYSWIHYDEYTLPNTIFTLYILVMLFLCSLACIDWPTNIPDYISREQPLTGRFGKFMVAVVRHIFQ
jgi:cellulose synthase (UDP-forming)